MYCCYVLYSKKFGKIYVGQTSHLIARFHSHNQLAQKGFTKKYHPWMVIFVDYYSTRKEAIHHEKKLKGGQGRQWIRDAIVPLYV